VITPNKELKTVKRTIHLLPIAYIFLVNLSKGLIKALYDRLLRHYADEQQANAHPASDRDELLVRSPLLPFLFKGKNAGVDGGVDNRRTKNEVKCFHIFILLLLMWSIYLIILPTQ